MIRAESLSLSYQVGRGRGGRALPVLDNVDFDVPSGRVVSLVGPSGCGKTTLLRVAAGLVQAHTGSLTLYRADDGDEGGEFEGDDVAMVFQSPSLLPWLNVRANVSFPMRMRRQKDAEVIKTRCDRLLDMVGITEVADLYPHQLSHGIAQRVALCRGLIGHPKVLLLDEPFSAVDALTREELDLELARLCHHYDLHMVFVTHSLAEAVLLSDWVVVLSARPAHTVACVPIELPWPRTADVLETAAFNEHVTTLRHALRTAQSAPEPLRTP